MASTAEILKAAGELGKMIAGHEITRRFEAVLGKLSGDQEAQRALNDLNRQIQKVAQKEESGQAVEVADKREVERLRSAVIKNPLLREFQMVQMDYADLMRQVDEAMSGQAQAKNASADAAGMASPSTIAGKITPQ
ncbi:MAG: YlbF family regulator [Phycisphaeraceae bacterium]|nr:YlbF family regulator [Phycisphaeraceae bacterium]